MAVPFAFHVPVRNAMQLLLHGDKQFVAGGGFALPPLQ
jgi:hypothetical protein